jgi:chitinase
LEAYQVSPFDVAHTIQLTRQAFDALGQHKLIVLSPECVGVYQGSPVTNSSGQAFNYWVPILNAVIDQVDLVQPQAYNNWYGHAGGSFEYLVDVYLNWLNEESLTGHPIQGFRGVPRNKLVLGLLASREAGGAAYYAEIETLARVGAEIKNRKGQKYHMPTNRVDWVV